jgi:hypothetical protein
MYSKILQASESFEYQGSIPGSVTVSHRMIQGLFDYS